MDKQVREYVKSLLSDKKGHEIDHIDRVNKLALSFADELNADKEIVELASYLHDVDDYKLFGNKSAESLTNAKDILAKLEISEIKQNKVLNIIKSMGYNRYLEGVRPTSIEGMIVSDADMCDAIGSIGIIRAIIFGEGMNRVFFDKSIHPKTTDISYEYKQIKSEHGVQHFFDKLLLIPSIMLTEPGRVEAKKREKIMIDFLRRLFEEENSDIWLKYLESFIKEV